MAVDELAKALSNLLDEKLERLTASLHEEINARLDDLFEIASNKADASELEALKRSTAMSPSGLSGSFSFALPQVEETAGMYQDPDAMRIPPSASVADEGVQMQLQVIGQVLSMKASVTVTDELGKSLAEKAERNDVELLRQQLDDLSTTVHALGVDRDQSYSGRAIWSRFAGCGRRQPTRINSPTTIARRNSLAGLPRTLSGASSSQASALSRDPGGQPLPSHEPYPSAADDTEEDNSEPRVSPEQLLSVVLGIEARCSRPDGASKNEDAAAGPGPGRERSGSTSTFAEALFGITSPVSADGSSTDTAGTAANAPDDGMTIECLIEEEKMKYYLCTWPGSSSVCTCFFVTYEDLTIDRVLRALLRSEERRVWDAEAEVTVFRSARNDDPYQTEDFQVIIHCPWPLWDRDLLQRRWLVGLDSIPNSGKGSAIVMRSFKDDGLLPEQPGRVRADVKKCGWILRPAKSGSGVDLSVIHHAEPGGLIPTWSQNILRRFAAQRVVQWAEKLHNHCVETE